MGFKSSANESDFEKIRKNNLYFVDKTEFIYEFVHETCNAVTVFTRPPRFGKTLMMSMMENFFSVRKDSSSLFEGLDISKHKDFCSECMNKYPVIYLSFKDVRALNFEEACGQLKKAIADACKDYSAVIRESSLDSFDIDTFNQLQDLTISDFEISHVITDIMRMLNKLYGKRVILLIDDYDVPLMVARDNTTAENKYYENMYRKINKLLNSSMKDNSYLKFGMITGSFPFRNESFFTGFNNYVSDSVLDNRFSSYFGFLRDEVEAMLESADRYSSLDTVKEWYSGYLFGSTELYCPGDVVSYVSELTINPDTKPKNYWKDVSYNKILLSFLKRTEFGVSGKFERLLNGDTFSQDISNLITNDIAYSSEDNLWSVLLMTGYVTKVNPKDQGEYLTLKIPNREISSIFEDTVVTLFKETLDSVRQKTIVETLWSGDENNASELITDLLWDSISYRNYHEDYYSTFLTTVFMGLGYEVQSSGEQGCGRFDIQVRDPINHRLIVIEAKKSVAESDMDSDCERAASQIIEKGYNQKPPNYKSILCYAVSFYQKQARVKLVCKNESKK